MLSPAQHFAARAWRRWPIIAAVAVIGGVAAGTWSVATAHTTWTGTTALTTQSQNRAPDQDAVLALGYVDYFNQSTYQELLRSRANVPDDVTLSAKTGATSPIFYIIASGSSEERVRAAAIEATNQYRNDVRDSLLAERREAVGDLQAEIDRNIAEAQRPERTDAERGVILEQIRSLQGRLTEFEADNTNLIKQLQTEPGVASSRPSPVIDIVTGLLAGAVIGVALAILLAAVDDRLRTGHDLGQRLGLRTFADFGRDVPAATRRRVLANVVNEMGLSNTEGRGKVVAVVAARRTRSSSALARELAELLAARRTDTLLILGDFQIGPDIALAGRHGLVDVLAGDEAMTMEVVRHVAGYDVLPSGSPGSRSEADSFTVVEPQRLAAVMEQARETTDVTIIDVPPVLQASESELFCANADHVIVVVESGESRVADLREALALLSALDAPVAGAVIELPDDHRHFSPIVLEEQASNGAASPELVPALPWQQGMTDAEMASEHPPENGAEAVPEAYRARPVTGNATSNGVGDPDGEAPAEVAADTAVEVGSALEAADSEVGTDQPASVTQSDRVNNGSR